MGVGYPAVYSEGKTILIHRYLSNAKKGDVVRHICFNKICLNENHLVLGTSAENNSDWDVIGDRHYKAIVPDWLVEKTKQLYFSGYYTQTRLAKWLTNLGYPTKQNTISSWCLGRQR